ncbi:uncharacterized protein FIBRA_03921 [Fibroporia radiculosa]|uniref:Uncharacterized protein n=1 Tax=Fibroporia radiculosa TaxID=599839 RepID=J4GNR5_9APHY|nr:uncharacterized protein FIBRA_03921 [Fibroporia radiculosa]CCM01850.1 predicted protein [Fibroporia radiculosa]
MAGVDMRLEARAIREFHWHKTVEWAYVLSDYMRVTCIDSPSPDVQVVKDPYGQVLNPSTFQMSTMTATPLAVRSVKIVDSRMFPAATSIAVAEWHPTQDEWTYYLSGQTRVTEFAPNSITQTFDFQLEMSTLSLPRTNITDYAPPFVNTLPYILISRFILNLRIASESTRTLNISSRLNSEGLHVQTDSLATSIFGDLGGPLDHGLIFAAEDELLSDEDGSDGPTCDIPTIGEEFELADLSEERWTDEREMASALIFYAELYYFTDCSYIKLHEGVNADNATTSETQECRRSG